MKQNFQILQSRYRSYQHIYTDGSKDGEKVGCVFISGNHSSSLRIPDGCSVFTPEAKAKDLALDFINNCSLYDKFVFFLFFVSLKSLKPYFLKKYTNSESIRTTSRNCKKIMK